jgi:plastocyanin
MLRKRFVTTHYVVWAACALLFAMGGTLPAAESRGTLQGRFVYDGDPPNRKKINVTKDQEVCGALGLRDEQLVISEDGGIKDVVLWVRTKDVPEPEGATKGATIELDNKGCRFAPHVVTMRPGDTLRVKNSDPSAHNTQISFAKNSAFNENIATGGSKDLKPTKDERKLVDISCSIHPWMKSWVLVKDTPYTAVTDANGNFEIKDLPVGMELEFEVVHPKSGSIGEVSKGDKKEKWKRGRFKTKIAAGTNDLGDLLVSPKEFK